MNFARAERIEISMQNDSDLDNLLLAFPCPIKWESMDGDERERLCKQCSQKVYNISDMTKAEAEAFLAERVETGNACLFFYKRADGTIKTDNCPRYLRPARNLVLWLHKTVSLCAAFLLTSNLMGCSGGLMRPFLKGIAYEPEGWETTGIAGRPAPNEIRENTYNVIFDARKYAPKELSERFKQEEKDHMINIVTLNSLAQEYREKKLPIQLFHVQVLKELVKQKMPQPQKFFDEKAFEELRHDALNEQLNIIETLLNEGNYNKAALKCDRFIELAKSGYSLKSSPAELPKNIREWKTLDDTPFLMSVVTMDRARELFRRTDREVCGVNELLLQLDSAKRLTLATAVEHHAIKESLNQERQKIMQINANLRYPCVIAKIVKTALNGNVTPPTATADYEVIQIIDENTPKYDFQFLYDKNSLGYYSSVVPSVGAVHILFLGSDPNSSLYTTKNGSYGRIDYDPIIEAALLKEKKKFNKSRSQLHDSMISIYDEKGDFVSGQCGLVDD